MKEKQIRLTKKPKVMITKEKFFSMTENDAIDYINDTFYSEDVNDVCESFLFGSGEYDEEELEEYLMDYQPFGFVIENYNGDKLKEILWNEIVSQCEEIEEDN